MKTAVRRVNVLVTDSFLHAALVRDFLDANGVGAKLVTKHAVQVLPSKVEHVKELNAAYPGWVENKTHKSMEESVA